jgi:hypothetical protein
MAAVSSARRFRMLLEGEIHNDDSERPQEPHRVNHSKEYHTELSNTPIE